MARDFAKIERYEALRSRLRDLVERRFHHNRAAVTDLDELERTIDRLEALVSVEPGQAPPAQVKAEGPPPAPEPEPEPEPVKLAPKPVAKAGTAAKQAKKATKPAVRPKAQTAEAPAACSI